MKPKFKVIDLTDHNNKKDTGWYKGTMPYMHMWLHSPKGSYLIKGYAHTVEEYTKKHFPIHVSNRKYFGPLRKENEGNWYFEGCYCYIDNPNKKSTFSDEFRKKYTFHGWIHGERKVFLELKRIPNKWIPEYDEIVSLTKKED
jgi:hypothetical protein